MKRFRSLSFATTKVFMWMVKMSRKWNTQKWEDTHTHAQQKENGRGKEWAGVHITSLPHLNWMKPPKRKKRKESANGISEEKQKHCVWISKWSWCEGQTNIRTINKYKQTSYQTAFSQRSSFGFSEWKSTSSNGSNTATATATTTNTQIDVCIGRVCACACFAQPPRIGNMPSKWKSREERQSENGMSPQSKAKPAKCCMYLDRSSNSTILTYIPKWQW